MEGADFEMPEANTGAFRIKYYSSRLKVTLTGSAFTLGSATNSADISQVISVAIGVLNTPG